MPTETLQVWVKTLIDSGFQQISRKYRMLARVPEGMTGVEAMRRASPAFVANLEANMERMCADQYMRCYARADEKIELSIEEFTEFLKQTRSVGE